MSRSFPETEKMVISRDERVLSKEKKKREFMLHLGTIIEGATIYILLHNNYKEL